MGRRSSCAVALLGLMLLVRPAWAAALTRADVTEALARASPDHKVDFAGQSLEKADLSGLDLAGVDFAGADLRNANLSDANLSGANLRGALMDLAWIMRTNFTGADLSGASLRAMVTSTGMEASVKEAANFSHATLAGARIIARLSFADLRSANFAGADMGVELRNQSMGMLRTELSDCEMEGADLAGANLKYALLRFAKLHGADLRGAALVNADLSGADLTDADLAGVDRTGADFGGAVLTGAKGLEAPSATR